MSDDKITSVNITSNVLWWILVLFVFHNLKFSFKYKKYYCIYLYFNIPLSKIRHSTQRLLVVECRKATHAWVGCRKFRHSITSKIRLKSNRIILHIIGIPSWDERFCLLNFFRISYSFFENRRFISSIIFFINELEIQQTLS